MIQHIFKILWNERKSNAWIIMEYIIIFCVLWFCSAYLYTMLRSYFGEKTFDLQHVYEIRMGTKPISDTDEIDNYALALIFLERVKRHPDIESVSLSFGAVPYSTRGRNQSPLRVLPDSTDRWIRLSYVTSDFFDVFRINVNGRIFDWQDNTDAHNVIISPFIGDRFGDNNEHSVFGGNNKDYLPVFEIDELWREWEWRGSHTLSVIGTTKPFAESYFNPNLSNVFIPMAPFQTRLGSNEIAIRVRPEVDSRDFPERFSQEMRDQLAIGPYFLSSVTSFVDIKEEVEASWGQKGRMNSTYAITSFLIINIFLGVLGIFWFRTQSRRNEIGLRLALGSSRRKVQGMVLLETMMLLTIASVIATFICLHLSNPEIIRMLGIPSVDKERWGIGSEQNFINFGITFGFLALVSVLAVWYPARQAAKIMPAETLYEE
jgi:putative ABC transport system permease protein